MKPPTIEEWATSLRTASRRIAVWTRRVSTHRAQGGHKLEPNNPVYILAAITLGIPALLLIPLVGMNPGLQEGVLTTLVMFLVISAFLTAMIFEIKRLADQGSDHEHD